jgi:hypothetical protein
LYTPTHVAVKLRHGWGTFVCEWLWGGDDGEFDGAGLGGGVVDALGGFLVVGGLGPEDVGDEGLGVAVVEGEPTGLDLHHDAVAGEEDVVGGGQIEAVGEGLVGGDGFGGGETLAVAAAEDVGGDHELVAAHVGLAGDLVGVEVDELDDPVGVGAGGGGNEVGDGLAADGERGGEDVGGEAEDVGTAGGFALVVDEPVGPGKGRVVADGLDGTGAEGYGFGGIGDVLVEGCGGFVRGGEGEFEAGLEVEGFGLWGGGPGLEVLPLVGAGLEGGDGSYGGGGGVVLEVVIEEGAEDVLAEVEAGVGAELDGAELGDFFDLLTVVPGTHDEEDLVVGGVFGLEGLVDGDGSVDVFLIPEAVDEHDGDFEGLGGEDLVHGLVAPEGVVGGVGEDLVPEAHLFEAVAASEFAGGACLHEEVVVVEVGGPPFGVVGAGAFLLVDVGHVLLAEGSVVEPVVAHPAVDHGVHGDGDLEGGVGVDEGHEGEEAVVGDAEDADFAVGLGGVFYEPVDGVVGIGGLVDGGGVLGAVNGAVHDEVALGAVLAADVLDDANVAAVDDDVGGVVVAVEDGAEVRAGGVAGELGGAVGSAGEEDGSVCCSARGEDDGVELDAVAHGDHDFAADVVEGFDGGLEVGGGFAGESGILGGLGGEGCREGCEDECDGEATERSHRGLSMIEAGCILQAVCAG